MEVFTPAGRSHWGNVNSLCGSLGTLFHLPSRNCSNEARHIAFHPSLPAIRHSSQFFRYGLGKVFVYTDTMQRATAAHSSPLPELSRAAPVHTRHPPPPTLYLESRTCNHFPQAVLQQQSSWMLFVRAPTLPTPRPHPPIHFTPPRSASQPKKANRQPGNVKKDHMVVICKI